MMIHYAKRPATMPFTQFMTEGSNGTLQPATWTPKADGFNWKVQLGARSNRVFFTKQGNRTNLNPMPSNVLEATVLFLEKLNPPLMGPEQVRFGGDGCQAKELSFEFSAYSLDDETKTDDLQLLFHKQCIGPDGQLDTERFGF